MVASAATGLPAPLRNRSRAGGLVATHNPQPITHNARSAASARASRLIDDVAYEFVARLGRYEQSFAGRHEAARREFLDEFRDARFGPA